MKRNILYAIILLAMCSLARASILSIESAQYNDGHSFVGPYSSLLDGNQIVSFCIDYGHNVGFHQNFNVSVVSLANFEGPMRTNYLEAAWIVLQMQNTTDLATLSDQQRGLWLITTPGTSDPYLTTIGAFTWATAAAQNYQSVDPSQFNLLLRNGNIGQSQITMIPEPGAVCWVLVGASLLVFLYLGRRQRAKK